MTERFLRFNKTISRHPLEPRGLLLCSGGGKVSKTPLFFSGKRECYSAKRIETVTVSFSAKVQKQLLCLEVHTVAGVQTVNCRSTVKFMFV